MREVCRGLGMLARALLYIGRCHLREGMWSARFVLLRDALVLFDRLFVRIRSSRERFFEGEGLRWVL